jgi:uncharacterized protein with PIN domain
MRSARFRFHGELNDFLPGSASAYSVDHEFELPRGVRDMIQAMGIPHVEVGSIEVNDSPVDFGHTIRDGDRIEVYPRFDRPARREMLHSPSVPHDFVIDVHLGKLARYLRLLGFDSIHRPDFDDHTLVALSQEQARTVLTRDRQLLMRTALVNATFIRSEQPRQQLVEVVDRLRLRESVDPFARCLACNGVVEQAAKAAIAHHLPPTVRANHDRFTKCPDCDRIYWPGTHYERLRGFVDQVLAGPTG